MKEDVGRELVNFAQFDAMIDGPESPCVSIYLDFVSGASSSINTIREAAGTGDRGGVESIGHQLKGAAASLGLRALSEHMAGAEHSAKQGGKLEAVVATPWLEEAVRLLEQTVALVQSERGIGE